MYPDATVQQELSPIVARFLPQALRPQQAAARRGNGGGGGGGGAAVPYLAVADDIGSRDVLEQGANATSGGYVVEDVDVDDDSDGSGGDASPPPAAAAGRRRRRR